MKNLAIVEPIPFTVGGNALGASRLASVDPREGTPPVTVAGARQIDIDLGAPTLVDTVFLGYSFSSLFRTATIFSGLNGYAEATQGQMLPADSAGLPFRHYLFTASVPFTARFIRITLPFVVGQTLGCLLIGKAFSPAFGQEWGAGRAIGDTGSATRLKGGGFGIDDGTSFVSYQWTFGDLSADETAQLYLIQRRRRTTRTVLVIEDPDATPGLNERIHYGLFEKLSAYERLDPINTKWALQVADWL